MVQGNNLKIITKKKYYFSIQRAFFRHSLGFWWQILLYFSPEDMLISSLFLKDFFTEYRILDWQFFLLAQYIVLFPFSFHGFW